MKDEKYLSNQRTFIKREQKIILRNHWRVSSLLLLLLCIVIFISVGNEHPSNWHRTTITLEKYKTIRTGRNSRLDIYDIDGNRYSINKNEGHIEEQLIVGQQYSFTYQDNLFHNIITELRIGDIEYLNYEEAIKDYWDLEILWWVLILVLLVILTAINLFVYYGDTKDRNKRLRKYRKRIYDIKNKIIDE